MKHCFVKQREQKVILEITRRRAEKYGQVLSF
jgi:hypothetical protein